MRDAAKWFRVKPSYQKPAGGFVAIGPRYQGEVVDDGKAVRFVHHGDQGRIVSVFAATVTGRSMSFSTVQFAATPRSVST
jgi:hypothetical protein